MPLRPVPSAPRGLSRRPSPAARRVAALAVAGAAAATLAACGDDPFDPQAQLDTQAGLVVVYPLSASSAELPVAVDLATLLAVRPGIRPSTGTPNFDFALDLEPNGQIRVLAPQYVILPVTGVPRVGFQTVSGQPFDDLAMAPQRNYRFDSVTVATVGQPVVVQTPGVSCTSTSPIAAKFVVDSVVGAPRKMFVRLRVNPNCGFRSLAPGRPEE
jgi:hypothetical protein